MARLFLGWVWAIGLFGGTLCAQRFPTLLEQRFFGTATDDRPRALCADEQGNLYLFGETVDRFGRTDCLVLKVSAEGTELWRQTWGGPGFESIRDAVFTTQGELYFCGVTGSDIPHPDDPFPERKADYYIGKLDPETGRRQWTRTVGGSARDEAWGITETNFGGVAVTGLSWSSDFDVPNAEHGLNNQWIVIMGADGRVLRSRVYGGNKNDWGADICTTPDGGFVAAGVTNSVELDFSQNRHNGDAWFMKLDFAGNLLWTQIVKKPYEDILYSVVANRYGLVVAVGSQVTAENGKQYWLLKLDERGRVVVDKQLGGYGFEELLGVAICQDGGMVMVGYSDYQDLTVPGVKGLRDVWVIRTNSQGDVLWQKTLGGPANEIGVACLESAEGVVRILAQKANTFNNPAGDTKMDFWLVTLRDQPCQDIRLDVVTDLAGEPRIRVGTPIKFTNRSTAGESFEWDFGDGTTSTERSPIHRYERPGVYTVKVVGTVNRTCKTVFIVPQPMIITP